MQYLLLIHGNTTSCPTDDEWSAFFDAAGRSGMFKGGSELGPREQMGETPTGTSDHIVGYMRFDTENKQALLDLLAVHPTVKHGGSIELCEMPRS